MQESFETVGGNVYVFTYFTDHQVLRVYGPILEQVTSLGEVLNVKGLDLPAARAKAIEALQKRKA